jgi:hypothetical protein
LVALYQVLEDSEGTMSITDTDDVLRIASVVLRIERAIRELQAAAIDEPLVREVIRDLVTLQSKLERQAQ